MNDKKDVLRPTIVMYVFVGLVGIWIGGCESQEQKVENLIKKLGYKKAGVRINEAEALKAVKEHESRRRCIPSGNVRVSVSSSEKIVN
jgi:hypothetical protein